MRHKFRGKLVRTQRQAAGDLVRLAERNEVIAECLYFSLRVETRLEEMKSGGTIEIVLDVVLPIPQQLDRCADLLGYPCRLDHVVVHEAPAEAAAATSHMDGDI